MDLKPCPFCGCTDKLDVQYRQALDRKRRYGMYDSAIYCRRCYSYGPRIRSEDLALQDMDFRNERPTKKHKDRMTDAALAAWNRRAE